MARGGGLNLLGALLSQAAVFLIMLLLARVLGIREVGRYAQCYAVLSLAGLLSLSGFRAGLTRFVAVHLADADAPALRGTIRLGLAVSAGSSVVLAGALAAAWSASLIVVNVARVVQVRHLTGALPFTVGMAKGLAAGVAALLAGLLVRWLVPGWPGRPAAGLTAIVAVYLGTVLALGLSREDVMVLRTLARRRRRGGPPDAAGDGPAPAVDQAGRAVSR
ncbi:oligosaccharide flippase family protein [Micromonospora sp. DH15]|nr:oligosaccharide flippase family protein [Micromonospora sp. DH15]